MGIKSKFENWLVVREFGPDSFQSFVCWMLFLGMVFSFFPPAIQVLFETGSRSCSTGTFTILAHYGIHEWLYDMFETFKDEHGGDEDLCYELLVTDSIFDQDTQPTIWIPENYLWLDEAEQSDEYGSELISNRTTWCDNITSIPFGIVTWKQYATELNYENPIDFTELVKLAKTGWNSYTNGDIPIGKLQFSHGHPNVTTSGALGITLGLQYLSNEYAAGDSWSYYEDDGSTKNYSVYLNKLQDVESNLAEMAPQEISLIATFLGHGPEYTHASFGYENDVVNYNNIFGDVLKHLWNDTLAFVYFSSTFWMNHPICVLDQVDWADKTEERLAIKFKDWVSNNTIPQELLDYGIRPYNIDSTILTSSIINENNGANPTITETSTDQLVLPSYVNTVKTRDEFQSLKRPVYLRLLLDTSGIMQTELTRDDEIRWKYASEGLTYFAEVLEDTAIYEIVCFADGITNCGGTDFPTNGTLKDTRSDIITFIDEELFVGQNEYVGLWDALNTTYNDLLSIKSNQEIGNPYNYVIVIISEEDTSEDDYDSLLDNIGINFDANEIHIFPILFWGGSTSTTATVMSALATQTNGVYFSTTKDINGTLEEIGWYF